LPKKVKGTEKDYEKNIRLAFQFVPYAPILFVSAHSGLGIPQIWEEVEDLSREWKQRFTKAALEEILEEAITSHTPPLVRGQAPEFFKVKQVKQAPPTIVVQTNRPEAIHPSYRRYLTGQFRKGLGLKKAPLRILLRRW
ncbi:MAG: ribosome biogenesis GTPase Der, partial [bacterium]|nr:ribosome biogenesis GTPase Der [bacterium]